MLVPLGITLWVLSLIIGTMDQSLALLPEAWRPDQLLFGKRVTGLGAILTLLCILLVGLLAHNFIGQRLVRWWEALLGHIPVVGPIYTSVKQVSDTLLSSSGEMRSARRCWCSTRVRARGPLRSGKPGVRGGDVQEHLQGEYVSVYVPTTPGPDLGLLPDDAQGRHHRTRHDRRRRAQVHRFDGRGGTGGIARKNGGPGRPADPVSPARATGAGAGREAAVETVDPSHTN
ncbi:DUF502 domain-containing protein [Cupriavidus basilensis]